MNLSAPVGTLIPEGLEPAVSPEKYLPEADVMRWRSFGTGGIIQELFRRTEGTFGVRYLAWVGWRDAGGMIRSHSWHRVAALGATVADKLEIAAHGAEEGAIALKLGAGGGWNVVV